jgi:tRNA-specific 2-thiouridylase
MMCNKLIKFGVFEEKWGREFDRIATGHYATTTVVDGKTWLSTAADRVKDQTYFLAQVDYLQISRLLFPIGPLQKSEVRAIALAQGLPSAQRKDSQGICFLGKINYNDFIRRYLGNRPGPIVELETGRVLGEHQGYWFHTIGQRRGLYLSSGPWFVVGKDVAANTLYVSNGYDPETQYGKIIDLQGFHFITDNPWGDWGDEKPVAFKVRHTPEFTLGTLRRTNEGYRIASDEKIQGIAAGQFGVIYDRDCRLCLGSGTIG